MISVPAKKYPKGIYHLFLTGMWERFSYYGITALLILYMVKFFDLPDKSVYLIYGAYGTLVYTTPMIGGYLADKYLGYFNAIIIGGVLIATGHFVMIIPDPNNLFFFFGLSIIIAGTGLFKPNIASITGKLYDDNDDQRDNGFTLLYVGINIGVIIAPIICSYIAVTYSWHLAFGIAGVGMLIGLVIFLMGKKHFPNRATYAPMMQHKKAFLIGLLFVIGLVTLTFLVFVAILYPWVVGDLLNVVGFSTLIIVVFLAIRSSREDRYKIILIALLTLFYVVFLALLQQSGGMLNVFTERNVNRMLFGYNIPTGMFQSVEPIFVVLFGPLYFYLWSYLSRKKSMPTYANKFAIGLFIIGLAFIVLVLGIQWTEVNGVISMWWINLSYLFQAAGELFIGPIGLAMISQMAPKNLVGFFMGAWILAAAFANFAAARVGIFISAPGEIGSSVLPSSTIGVYYQTFIYLAALGIAAGILLFAISPWLKKLEHSHIG